MNISGSYELSTEQQDAFMAVIKKQFGVDSGNGDSIVIHPMSTPPEKRHIDSLMGCANGETILATFGCSAKQTEKTKSSAAEWYRPLVEVYLKLKSAKPDAETGIWYHGWIQRVCGNFEDCENAELAALNGYEYLFFDKAKDFHKQLGYWGVLIVPRLTVDVSGVGDVLCYQLIPMYREELQFIEQHPECDYHKLCEQLASSIGDRYFDVPAPAMTMAELYGAMAASIPQCVWRQDGYRLK